MENEYEFEGYDYDELAKSLGITLDEDSLDLSISITNYLRTLSFYDVNHQEVVDKCRCYLTIHKTLCIEENIYDSYFPVWEGLLKVKDDFTFLQIFADLVGHMWY